MKIFPYREIFPYRNKKGLKLILIGDSYRKIYSIGKYFPIVFFFKRPMYPAVLLLQSSGTSAGRCAGRTMAGGAVLVLV